MQIINVIAKDGIFLLNVHLNFREILIFYKTALSLKSPFTRFA